MAHILHITCDFPDPLQINKTQAIKRLVDGTPQHRHTVYSMNRVDGFSGIELLQFGTDRFAIAYRAPPKGLLLQTRLNAVAKFIQQDIRHRKLRFDLVHAHKLTIDGIVGQRLAAELGLPIIFSLQGDTDFKVISARPDLLSTFKNNVACAEQIFCFAPWSLKKLLAAFPVATAKAKLLPVLPEQDALSVSPVMGSARLVSVFHLDSWKRKNLHGMAQALKLLSHQLPGIHLDVIGGGSAKSFMEAQQAVREAGAEHLITFKGAVANGQISAALKTYVAFILPTLRESYGLVHVESMFAGLPVLVSRDMGIDGLLPECSFIARCDPRSTQSIADAALQLLKGEETAKLALAAAQKEGMLDVLRRNAILNTYHRGLQDALRERALQYFQADALIAS